MYVYGRMVCRVSVCERGFVCMHTVLGVCASRCMCVSSQTIKHALSGAPHLGIPNLVGDQTPLHTIY